MISRGIIPARAGFTCTLRYSDHGPGDHPRSRGVYRSGRPAGAGLQGSSPLARGLHVAATRAAGGRRIIPARAGFTDSSSSAGPTGADHPRSRGVYRRRGSLFTTHVGSSPLARGLPTPTPTISPAARIIPARAGFTTPVFNRLLHGGDHPRSRGVYKTGAVAQMSFAGSSPLARGLPLIVDPRLRGEGIIPARAGFTLYAPHTRDRAVDHPRSRGVYLGGAPQGRGEAGSSPLARGLRRPRAARGGPRRIIPARAGFTRVRRRR